MGCGLRQANGFTRLLDEKDGESTMQLYKAGDNEFLELVHVALRLRSDILAQPCHKGLDISEDAVMACVPDSLNQLPAHKRTGLLHQIQTSLKFSKQMPVT